MGRLFSGKYQMEVIERGLFRVGEPRGGSYVFRREVRFFDKQKCAWVTRNIRRELGGVLRTAQAEAGRWHKFCDSLERGEVPAQRLGLGEFHRLYIEGLRGCVGDATLTTMRCNTAPLVGFLGAEAPLDRITRADVERFLNERRRNVSTATMAGTCRELKRMFDHAVAKGYADGNPMEGMRFERAPRAEPRLPTPEDVIRLRDYLRAAMPELYPVFVALVFSGARLSEILRLDWKYVDHTQGTITLVRTKVRDQHRMKMAGPLVSVLMDLWMEAGMPREGTVFSPRKDGKPWTRYLAYERLKRAAKALGMDWLMAKTFRNNAGTRAVHGTGNPRASMEVLGHTLMSTSVGYWGDRDKVRSEGVAAVERWAGWGDPSKNPSKGGAPVGRGSDEA